MSQKPVDNSTVIGKPLNLAQLLSYQDSAVVSRALISKTVGTLTLFSFDLGQGLSEHTAPFDAAVIIVEGKAEVTISGVKQSVASGEMIIMPANKPHSLFAAERFKMLLVMIKA